MNEFNQDLCYEVAELSKAVFSDDKEVFDDYKGEVDDYGRIKELRNQIREALGEIGEETPQLDELPSFQDFGYDEESWASVFYCLQPNTSHKKLAESSDFSRNYMSDVLGSLQDESLVESIGDTRSTKYFYGERALPYLMLFSGAEKILQDQDCEASENTKELIGFEENSGSDESVPQSSDEGENTSPPEERQDNEKTLQEIMEDVADGDNHMETTHEQEDDGGIEARDHTDEEEDQGNVANDTYYEGW